MWKFKGVEPNAQPPRIQVALATGKLVLPEQGCLGQGGCEAKPDYDKVWKPNAQLNIDENPCRHGADFFLFWEARQDFTQIYGQSAFFC